MTRRSAGSRSTATRSSAPTSRTGSARATGLDRRALRPARAVRRGNRRGTPHDRVRRVLPPRRAVRRAERRRGAVHRATRLYVKVGMRVISAPSSTRMSSVPPELTLRPPTLDDISAVTALLKRVAEADGPAGSTRKPSAAGSRTPTSRSPRTRCSSSARASRWRMRTSGSRRRCEGEGLGRPAGPARGAERRCAAAARGLDGGARGPGAVPTRVLRARRRGACRAGASRPATPPGGRLRVRDGARP